MNSDPRERRRTGRAPLTMIAIAVLFAVLLAVGYLPRLARAKQLAEDAAGVKSSLPEVTVLTVRPAKAEAELALPGNIQAVTEAVIFARAEGYVKRRLADIGDRVTAGQLLAEIDSPEVEQQLRQARAAQQQSQSALEQAEAALEQAKANMSLAEVTTERWQRLVDRGVLAKQDGDEKRSAYIARQADVRAAEANIRTAKNAIAGNEANVQRLVELQSFQKVRAPFSGIVTARGIDVGSLVSSGSSSNLHELFRIAQIDRLRIYVNVPQSEVTSIRVGQPASVAVQELGHEGFPGQIVRTANSLDAASRTLLTEVQLANPGGKLLPGMYAQVKFTFHRDHAPLLVPGNALVSAETGPQVALLRGDGTVHYQKLQIGRDYGPELEILSGIQAGDTIITNPSDAIREGQRVRVAQPFQKKT